MLVGCFWLVGLFGVVFWVPCFAFVCDLSLESVFVVSNVFDDLYPSVWERHLVTSLHGVAVAGLGVAVVGAGVIVTHSVVERVWLGRFL